MSCNPYAIFKTFMQEPNFNEFVHIWTIRDETLRTELKNTYSLPNVKFVDRDLDYAKYLAIAEYIVENVSFPHYFAKRTEQTTIHTWHSITVKTLGVDDNRYNSKNTVRSFLNADYIISPNDFMTNIYKNSYQLGGIYPGKVLEIGYPRNDLTLRGSVEVKAKKTLLYAPTWRGTGATATATEDNYNFIKETKERLACEFEEYNVLVRLHNLSYKLFENLGYDLSIFVAPTIDANEMLSQIDMLITDYSSIYMDFMLTDRPIYFYWYDYDEYNAVRGVYFKPDELPGEVSYSMEELFRHLKQHKTVDYAKLKQKYLYNEDGFASKRCIDIAFNKMAKESAFEVAQKKKLLLDFSNSDLEEYRQYYRNVKTIRL